MSLRVLHISTVDQSGGAARAAWNLFRGLQEIGCDARMLVRDCSLDEPTCTSAGSMDAELQRRHDKASVIQRKLINPSRAELSNTWFSLPEPGWDISRHPEVCQADILHLHWVSGFLSPASIAFLQRTGKPIVWSLHDQRPFTGGCHFSAGCRRFESDCGICPQLSGPVATCITGPALAETKRQLDPSRMTLVCPSRWMADCARGSALFSRARVEVIPYAVQTETFSPARRSREELGWSPDCTILLAGADSTSEIRKGFRFLADALRKCAEDPDFKTRASAGRIRLVLFGKAEPPSDMPLRVDSLGMIGSQEQLARLYASADLFVVPSLEDNLPNTALESLRSAVSEFFVGMTTPMGSIIRLRLTVAKKNEDPAGLRSSSISFSNARSLHPKAIAQMRLRTRNSQLRAIPRPKHGCFLLCAGFRPMNDKHANNPRPAF